MLPALAAAAPPIAPPSGSRPISSGRCFSSRFSGPSSASTRMPSIQHPLRQPPLAIRDCSQGRMVIEPIPTPENAMLIASPRRRTNQCGR